MGLPALRAFYWRFIGYILLEILAVYFTLKQLFSKHSKLTHSKTHRNLTAIVTGGLKGIGLEITRQLLQRGVTVITASLKKDTDHDTLKDLQTKYKDKIVTNLTINLGSLDSIKKFVEQFTDLGLPVNILICNAGVMIPPYMETEDGFESQFGINYLGHAYLTHLLLPHLRKAGTPDCWARVIFVASSVHYGGELRFEDLHGRVCYSPERSYMQSKLACVTLALLLDRRLRAEGAAVAVSAVDPGVVRSSLYQFAQWYHFSGPAWPLLLTTAQGSDCAVFAGLAGQLEGRGGLYIENCKPAAPNPLATDQLVQETLWRETKRLLGIESTW